MGLTGETGSVTGVVGGYRGGGGGWLWEKAKSFGKVAENRDGGSNRRSGFGRGGGLRVSGGNPNTTGISQKFITLLL